MWPPALALALVLLAGCAGPVPVEEPTPDAAATAVCEPLLAALPDTVDGQSRRETRPGRFTAAWGDPPISVRCGVPRPAALSSTSSCFEVDGVGWFAEPAEGGHLFTTIGRAAFVEVGVPADYAPEANVLVDLAGAINEHDPVRTPCA